MPTKTKQKNGAEKTRKVEWKRVKLGEVCDFSYGFTASAKNNDTGVKLIRITDIVPQLIDWNNVPFCKIEENKLNQFLLKKGDIVVARTGATAGYAKLFRKDPPVNSVFASYLIRIKPKIQDLDNFFLGSLLESDIFKNFVVQNAGGAAQPHANAPVLKEFEFLLPPLSEQKKIAEVLSACDDLIEVNQKKIKTLETLAQTLYKEWFVKPVKDGLPDGWEVKKVEDLIERVSVGKKYDNKTALPVGNVPILDQGKSGVIGYHNDEPSINASTENPVIVFANHTCYQNLIMFPFSAIQNVLPFYPSKENYRNIFWLHFATKDLISFNDYKGHWPEFSAKKVYLPPVDLCEKFGEYVKEMMIEKYNLEKQNQNLQKTRDILIPQLVGGRVGVK